jgi:hypothetical protein
MSDQPSPEWVEMAIDVIRASRKHWSTDDYRTFSKISYPLPGRGYLDRMKVLDRLIDDGMISLEDRKIIFNSMENVDWVSDGLISGSKTVWDLVEIAEPNGNLAGKYDGDRLAEIGEMGEQAVIEFLHESLPINQRHRVLQVSQTNDSAGYDIVSPSLRDISKNVLLEVKTTVRPGSNFSFYLSRNEHRVGIQNPNWYLIFVRVLDSVPKIVGNMNASCFESWLPIERDDRSRWESVKITVVPSELSVDFP